jgi:hypothetical protein
VASASEGVVGGLERVDGGARRGLADGPGERLGGARAVAAGEVEGAGVGVDAGEGGVRVGEAAGEGAGERDLGERRVDAAGAVLAGEVGGEAAGEGLGGDGVVAGGDGDVDGLAEVVDDLGAGVGVGLGGGEGEQGLGEQRREVERAGLGERAGGDVDGAALVAGVQAGAGGEEAVADGGDRRGEGGVARGRELGEDERRVGAGLDAREAGDGLGGVEAGAGGVAEQADGGGGGLAAVLEAADAGVEQRGRELAAAVVEAGVAVGVGPRGGVGVEAGEDAGGRRGVDGAGDGGAGLVVPRGGELGGAAGAGGGRVGAPGRDAEREPAGEPGDGGGEPAAAGRRGRQRGEQRVHVGPAAGGVDGEAAAQHLGEAALRAGAGGRVDDLAGHHRERGLGVALAAERAALVQRLPQRDAEAELVGAGVGELAHVLLGRHVRGRAEDRAGGGERDVERVGAREGVGVGGAGIVGAVAGEPEVGDAHAALRADQHVLGLENPLGGLSAAIAAN